MKKVLVILPRNMDHLEGALDFVQSLWKTYPLWRVELFDVDKLDKSDLNPMRIPRPQLIQRLRKADY
ncbi:MAG: hypothetical protein ACE5GL_11265, partial [Calditrichia bacterium]